MQAKRTRDTLHDLTIKISEALKVETADRDSSSLQLRMPAMPAANVALNRRMSWVFMTGVVSL